MKRYWKLAIAAAALATGCHGTGYPGGSAPYAGASLHSAAPLETAQSERSKDSLEPLRKNIEPPNTNQFDSIQENDFLQTVEHPLATFGADVDTASYTIVRRFIESGSAPPKAAVRLEELINYFTYRYPQPSGDVPFSITTEVAECPWAPDHQLLLVGLSGKKMPVTDLPPANLVFLIDVSGSMSGPDRLPLAKTALLHLTEQLRPQDKVAIVAYAGQAGLVLGATPGSERSTIRAAIERLESGGSTAGGQGIQLAYAIAKNNFVKSGNNRVILATDGDFNVGVSSDGELEEIIVRNREEGVFLSVLGFGMGNYKDGKLEMLADKGNGNYAYVDGVGEAKRLFDAQLSGTLFTIAKDVKLQLEPNPAFVKEYRLLGYENRLLRRDEFADDKKDAGELGSGHTVTALFELVPAAPGTASELPSLKYQTTTLKPDASSSNELGTLRVRYKKPDGESSTELVQAIGASKGAFSQASENLRWASTVASFGMLLRDSRYKGRTSYAAVAQWGSGAKGSDENGARAEFLTLVTKAQSSGTTAQ